MAERTETSLMLNRQERSGERERILVLGLGNILLKDEGVGVHVAEELQKRSTFSESANVEVIDGGTAGLDILLSQRASYKLVVVDAIRSGKKAGTIYKLRLKAGEKNKLAQIFGRGKGAKISLHQVGLIEALAAAEKLNCAPAEVVIIGVEPEEISSGLELTEQVSQKIPEIVKAVLEEINDAVHKK